MSTPPKKPARPSRYKDGFDYDHRFHAGNPGDVFKHCALRQWAIGLQAQAGERPLHLVDTHSGAGMFKLGPQGEWLQGIGRLDDALGGGRKDAHEAPPEVPGPVWDFWQATEPTRRRPATPAASKSKRAPKGQKRGGLYPGSPALMRELLRPQDRLTLCELMEAPAERLETFYSEDTQVVVRRGDGLQGAKDVAEAAPAGAQVAVFIDPPYVSKREWQDLAAAIPDIIEASPGAAVAVWYPIKSLTRPRGLLSAVQRAGLSGRIVDVIHTPLRLQRKRMNGSGMLFVAPPSELPIKLGPAAHWLGETLATDAEWQVNTLGW